MRAGSAIQHLLSVEDLRSLAAEWLLDGEARHLSRRTLAERRRLLTEFEAWLTEKQVPGVGRAEVRGFLATYADLKPSTASTYFGRLRTFFTFAVAEGLLDASPMADLRPPVSRSDQVQPFSEDQVRALLEAAGRSRYPVRNRALLLVLLDTGLRAEELCRLVLSDVDVPGRRVVVRGKGDKVRTVYFGPATARAILAYLRSRGHPGPSEPLFTGARGGMTVSGLFQTVQRLGVAVGLEAVRCSPHTFRHTFAVVFLRSGGSLFALQSLLGHTSLAMTRRYAALAQADLEAQHRDHSPVDYLSRDDRKRR